MWQQRLPEEDTHSHWRFHRFSLNIFMQFVIKRHSPRRIWEQVLRKPHHKLGFPACLNFFCVYKTSDMSLKQCRRSGFAQRPVPANCHLVTFRLYLLEDLHEELKQPQTLAESWIFPFGAVFASHLRIEYSFYSEQTGFWTRWRQKRW